MVENVNECTCTVFWLLKYTQIYNSTGAQDNNILYELCIAKGTEFVYSCEQEIFKSKNYLCNQIIYEASRYVKV
jgi:hypothetical protein